MTQTRFRSFQKIRFSNVCMFVCIVIKQLNGNILLKNKKIPVRKDFLEYFKTYILKLLEGCLCIKTGQCQEKVKIPEVVTSHDMSCHVLAPSCLVTAFLLLNISQNETAKAKVFTTISRHFWEIVLRFSDIFRTILCYDV